MHEIGDPMKGGKDFNSVLVPEVLLYLDSIILVMFNSPLSGSVTLIIQVRFCPGQSPPVISIELITGACDELDRYVMSLHI